MKEKNTIVSMPDCQQTMPVALASILTLYKEAAEKNIDIPRQPRKVTRLRNEAIAAYADCLDALQYRTGDCWKIALEAILKYSSTRFPWYENGRGTTEAEALEYLKKQLNRFIAASKAPKMTYCSFSVEWKKSRTWGWCPRVYVRTNEHTGEYYSSGCGYDKLSHAFNHALQSPTLTRFAIENVDKLKGVYGFSYTYGLPEIDFAGCGLGTFETMLEKCDWPKYQNHRRNYDRKGSTIGANYSMN